MNAEPIADAKADVQRVDELTRRMLGGDEHAMEEWIALLYPEILRYCLWHAPNRALAEDAAQETFLKAIRYLDRYVPRGKLRPFLYRIAANTCLDMRRQRWFSHVPYDEIPVEPSYDEAGFDRVDAASAWQARIRALPAEQQEVVILRFGQGLSLREIAGAVDAPLRTVQSRLRAALKRLKNAMKEEIP